MVSEHKTASGKEGREKRDKNSCLGIVRRGEGRTLEINKT